MFQGTGTRGRTGGWSSGDDGLDGSLGSSSGSFGRGNGFNGNGPLSGSDLGMVMRRGSDEGAKNGGGS